MTVLLKQGTWLSIAPAFPQSTGGNLFILRIKPLRPERRFQPQGTVIHFLACRPEVKIEIPKLLLPETEVTLTDDHVI